MTCVDQISSVSTVRKTKPEQEATVMTDTRSRGKTGIEATQEDIGVLQELGRQYAEIAALPVQAERIAEWTRHNGLKAGRPLVYVWPAETPWHEMNVDDELTIRCSDRFCRRIEGHLRRMIYQWKHMPGDMVVENVLECPTVHRDSGMGIDGDTDKVVFDPNNPVTSRHFKPVIKEPEDIERITMPVVTYDREATRERLEFMQKVFDGIVPVRLGGERGYWFAAMDELIMLWGIQELLTDLVVRPEMVHAAMERVLAWHNSRLDQWEELGLLRLNNDAHTAGTGGYGYTDELPPADFDPAKVRAKDSWGSAASQMFATVSPEMHAEFSTAYEKRFLSRFGLNWYGCCDPLHHKIDVVETLPNLRKISMSPWNDHAVAAPIVGSRYVYSFKPNPAVVAQSSWDPEAARRDIRKVLDITKKSGCVVEIIPKDITTVAYEPARLWEWTRVASEEAAAY
jgi:hypothetical protein